MKHEHWELVIDGKVASRIKEWDIDADVHARQLSMWAPLLTVQLFEGWNNDQKLISTWRKGKKVKV